MFTDKDTTSKRRLRKIRNKKTGNGTDIFRLLNLNVPYIKSPTEQTKTQFSILTSKVDKTKKRFEELKYLFSKGKLHKNSRLNELRRLYKFYGEDVPSNLIIPNSYHPSYKPVKISKRKRKPSRYTAYIESKYWEDRKNKYYQIHGKKCSVCGSTRYVSLHHLDYTRLGDELDEDLVAACWSCHKKFHEKYGVHRESKSDWMEFAQTKGVTIEIGNNCVVRVTL
jgi:5-methylcytosine-specific restriction endonuclease McrA